MLEPGATEETGIAKKRGAVKEPSIAEESGAAEKPGAVSMTDAP